MPYTISRSRKEFDGNVNKLFANIKNLDGDLDYSLLQQVLQSYFFSTSSFIENYLANMFDDWLYTLKAHKVKNALIPMNLRKKIFFEFQKDINLSYIIHKDEKRIYSALNLNRWEFEILEDQKNIASEINKHNILYTDRYPSVRNLKRIFLRLGMSNIFDEMGKIGKNNYKNVIISFMDIRENIAHSVPDDLTFLVVKDNHHKIKDFIRIIDRVFYRLFGRNAWVN